MAANSHRFRVGDSVSVPWFSGKRLHGVVKQIRADGQMVIDSPTSGLHAVPARQGRKWKRKLKGAVGRLVNPGPSAIPSKWTNATVSRKGGQIQIRIGGRR